MSTVAPGVSAPNTNPAFSDSSAVLVAYDDPRLCSPVSPSNEHVFLAQERDGPTLIVIAPRTSDKSLSTLATQFGIPLSRLNAFRTQVQQGVTRMNEIVITSNGQLVATTMAIAEGTKVEHKAVIQLVRTYLADLEEFGRVTFEMRPFETAGGAQTREIAELNEQQATLILTYMRNSEIVRTFKKRLVKDFWSMRAKLAAKPILDPTNLTRLQLMQIAMDAENERLVLEGEVAVLKPIAVAMNRIADADGTMNPTVAAKTLQLPPKKLFDFLRESKWIYRRPGGSGNVAYQDKIQAGLLTHKVTTIQREDGTDKVVEQVLVTGKGLAKLAMLLGLSVKQGVSDAEMLAG